MDDNEPLVTVEEIEGISNKKALIDKIDKVRDAANAARDEIGSQADLFVSMADAAKEFIGADRIHDAHDLMSSMLEDSDDLPDGGIATDHLCRAIEEASTECLVVMLSTGMDNDPV